MFQRTIGRKGSLPLDAGIVQAVRKLLGPGPPRTPQTPLLLRPFCWKPARLSVCKSSQASEARLEGSWLKRLMKVAVAKPESPQDLQMESSRHMKKWHVAETRGPGVLSGIWRQVMRRVHRRLQNDLGRKPQGTARRLLRFNASLT